MFLLAIGNLVSFIGVFYAFGVLFQGKGKVYGLRLFSLILLTVSVGLMCLIHEFYLESQQGLNLKNLYLIPFSVIGFLYYYYLKYLDSSYRIKPKDYFQLIPFFTVLSFLYLSWFSNSDFFSDNFQDDSYPPYLKNIIEATIFLQNTAYVVLRIKNKFLKRQNHLNLWIRFFDNGYIFLLILLSTSFLGSYSDVFEVYTHFAMALLLITIIVFTVYHISYEFDTILFPKKEVHQKKGLKRKYSNSGLSIAVSQDLRNNLTKLMVNEKVYLNHDLRLNDLAKQLNISSHQASQLINESFGVNFNDYINNYRLFDAKESLCSAEFQNISEIAYRSGFNTRTSFYKAFKKKFGKTPTEFRNMHHHSLREVV